MTANTYARLRPVYDEAMLQPACERTHWVRSRCGDDSDLAAKVIAFLSSGERAGNRFEPGAWQAPIRPEIRMIGPYEILKKLGSGGMSDVYLARRADGTFNRQVAIKLLKQEMKLDGVVERFLQERNILASLRHPNIAALYDGGTTAKGDDYLVMEYVDGRHLDEYCDDSQATLAARLGIFYTICYAVEYLHSQGITHRDLKPANILVDAAGSPIILDFGIARQTLPNEAGLTSVLKTPAGGTPAYASPEQLQCMPVCHRSDIYSLGVILFRLIAGRRPFVEWESTPTAMLMRILQPPPPPPSRFLSTELAGAPHIGRLDGVVLRCLEVDPLRRFGSAAELAEAVKHACLVPVQPAEPVAEPSEPSKPAAPRRVWLLSSLSAAALLPLPFLLPIRQIQPQAPITPQEDRSIQTVDQPKVTIERNRVATAKPTVLSADRTTAPDPVAVKPTARVSEQDLDFLNRHTQIQGALVSIETTMRNYEMSRTMSDPLYADYHSFLHVAKAKTAQAAQSAQSGNMIAAWTLLREAEGNINALRKFFGV